MIYFIADAVASRIKIGFSVNPWKRLGKIQSDCCNEVTLLAVIEGDTAREAEIHAQFASSHVRREWFNMSPELSVYIASLPQVAQTPKRPSRFTWGDSTMTDGDLAPLLGCDRATANRIRNGKLVPTLPMAIRISELTGMSIEQLAEIASMAA